MVKKGEQIRQHLLIKFQLAFKKKTDQSTHLAAVYPVKISVNKGARPMCRTVANKVAVGMAKDCKALINQLLA